MNSALERIRKARSLPQQFEALELQLQAANQQIRSLQNQFEAMSRTLKKHLHQHKHYQQKPKNLLDRLLSR